MSIKKKTVIAFVIFITSCILCMNVLFLHDFELFISHVIHCIAEGIIILMFSRELRGDSYR